MQGRFSYIAGALLGVLLLFTWNQAHAVITAKTPLTKFEGDAVFIVVGKVDKYFPEKPAMLVTVIEDIKGTKNSSMVPLITLYCVM